MNKKDLDLLDSLLEDYLQSWDMTNYNYDELLDLRNKIKDELI